MDIDSKCYELIAGAGLEPILIPRKAFIKEHKNLLKVLKSQDPSALRKEYEEQKGELQKELKGGALSREQMTVMRDELEEEAENGMLGEEGWSLYDRVFKILFKEFPDESDLLEMSASVTPEKRASAPPSQKRTYLRGALNTLSRVLDKQLRLTGGATRRESFLKKFKVEDKPYSIKELSKISSVPIRILQEVYNRGVGAYKTNPTSVRLKGSYVKNVKAPMRKKLSKEQWGMARVFSFLDGNPKHDNDLRQNSFAGRGHWGFL